jgi:hypothetical protein
MGFYLRKSVSFGPFRLNLSRSGLGTSFGVKGARIGVGPRGSYVHMGRGGLYYRQTLTPPSGQGHFGQPPVASPTSQEVQPIVSSPASALADGSAVELLQELNRVQKRRDRFPWLLVGGGLLVFWMAQASAPVWVFAIGVSAVVVLCLWTRNADVVHGTAILNYHLESDASQDFAKMRAAFDHLRACQHIWCIDAAAHNADAKYNAGATTNFRRKEIRPQYTKPPKVQCNLDVPMLQAGKTSLFFFPDRLLVYDSTGVGTVSYHAFEMDATQTRFVENEAVPRDAQKVDSTWQYVNKRGGPDRRFQNNRQFPVVLYSILGLGSSSGLKTVFLCSQANAGANFCATFPKVARAQGTNTSGKSSKLVERT